MKKDFLVTVGIPAFREPLIGRCLKSILAERVKKEVIVITPDEATAVIARGFRGVKVVLEKSRRGKPAAVNEIISRARGDVIVLTDADMFVKKGSLSKLVSHFADKRVSVTCARPFNVNHVGMFGFFGDMLYDIIHKKRLSGFNHLSTNLCAFRRGVVRSIPNESLVDDYVIGLLAQKHGRFIYEPGAVVYAKFPSNASDFIKQRVRTFAGYMQVRDWFGDSSRSFLNEARGASSVFSYIKSPKHLFWIAILVLLRVYAWLKAYITYKFLKRDLKTVWTAAESTKR